MHFILIDLLWLNYESNSLATATKPAASPKETKRRGSLVSKIFLTFPRASNCICVMWYYRKNFRKKILK